MRVPSILPGLDTVEALRNPADEAVCVDEGLLMRSLITPAGLSSSFSFKKLRPLQSGVGCETKDQQATSGVGSAPS